MADCIRVPLLLLLMCILSSVHSTRGENIFVSKHAAKADIPPNPAGGPLAAAANLAAAADKIPGAGASVLRKRNTGWKLAEEAVCRDDLTRLCPKQSWSNNLAVLECLQDRKEVNIQDAVPAVAEIKAGCACASAGLVLAGRASQPIATAVGERHANLRPKYSSIFEQQFTNDSITEPCILSDTTTLTRI